MGLNATIKFTPTVVMLPLLCLFAALAIAVSDLGLNKSHQVFYLGMGFSLACGYLCRRLRNFNLLLGAFIALFCIQFFLSPFILQIITNNFSNYSTYQSLERISIRESYGQAMLICGLWLAVFYLLIGLLEFKLMDYKIAKTGSFNGLLFFGTVLWISRLYALQEGYFYHITKPDAYNTDITYSYTSQIDALLGIYCLALFYERIRVRKGMENFFAWIAVISEFAWRFISGSRGAVIYAVLALFVTHFALTKRISRSAVLFFILVSVPLIGFMDFYRYAIVLSSKGNEINLGSIVSAIEDAGKNSEKNSDSILEQGLWRLCDLESVAAICHNVPEFDNFLWGKTYSDVALILMPRFLFPEKPSVQIPLNSYYFTREGGTCPMTIMGEGYFNFGWLGVGLAGIASSLIFIILIKLINFSIRSSLGIGIYTSLFFSSLTLYNMTFGLWISLLLRASALVSIVYLGKLFLDKKRRLDE